MTDNTKTLYNALDKIKKQKEINNSFYRVIERVGKRNNELKAQVERLEKEKCELLGLIQEKDKLIEKMKCCGNCNHFNFNEPNYCHKGVFRERQYVCSEWVLAE